MKSQIKQVKESIYIVFKLRTSSLSLLFLVFILILCFFCFSYKSNVKLLPGELETFVFNDSLDGGNSVVKKFQSSSKEILLEYELKEGFVNPYMGLTFIPTKGNEYIDFQSYDNLHLSATCNKKENFFVSLISEDKSVKNKTHRLSDRHSSLNIQIPLEHETLDLDINNFKTPTWWFEVVGQAPVEFGPPDLSKVKALNISSGVSQELNIKHTLKINSIILSKNHLPIILLFSIVPILYFLILVILNYLTFEKKLKKPIEIKYQATELKLDVVENNDVFLSFIHENYNNPDLSLSKVAKYTKTHERTISKYISSNYGCNFKTYINKIRITESQRLLANSKLNISEIAYTVGFNSPSTFNKVFKKLTGKTPSDLL